jgi:hypothetical protein
MEACELWVEMKDFAYYKHDGMVDTEPATAFKEWMEKSQYDPEHRKNEPITSGPEPAGTSANAPQVSSLAIPLRRPSPLIGGRGTDAIRSSAPPNKLAVVFCSPKTARRRGINGSIS